MNKQQLPPSPSKNIKHPSVYKLDEEDFDTLLASKFNSKIQEFANGDKSIDGLRIIEQFYHSYLASGNNILKKKQLKHAIYNYILINNLKVIGGKFNKSNFQTRILYYSTI